MKFINFSRKREFPYPAKLSINQSWRDNWANDRVWKRPPLLRCQPKGDARNVGIHVSRKRFCIITFHWASVFPCRRSPVSIATVSIDLYSSLKPRIHAREREREREGIFARLDRNDPVTRVAGYKQALLLCVASPQFPLNAACTGTRRRNGVKGALLPSISARHAVFDQQHESLVLNHSILLQSCVNEIGDDYCQGGKRRFCRYIGILWRKKSAFC